MTAMKHVRQDILSRIYEFSCDCIACKNDWSECSEPPLTLRAIENEILARHSKTIKKLTEGKKHRVSTKTIRSFMQDTEVLLKSGNGPTFLTNTFRSCLHLIIVHRYFKELNVPAECENNLNK